MAWAHGGSAKRGWRVRGDVGERTNAVVASVQSAVHVFGRLFAGHRVYVQVGCGRTDVHGPGRWDGMGAGVRRCDARVEL
eukprot:2030896-Pleurochrysis_carterae.AAC.1